MPLFGTITVWAALVALLVSLTCYLVACARRGAADGGAVWARAGRAAFFLAALCVLGTATALGTLLVTHRFDVQYVYDHSARAMAPAVLLSLVLGRAGRLVSAVGLLDLCAGRRTGGHFGRGGAAGHADLRLRAAVPGGHADDRARRFCRRWMKPGCLPSRRRAWD